MRCPECWNEFGEHERSCTKSTKRSNPPMTDEEREETVRGLTIVVSRLDALRQDIQERIINDFTTCESRVDEMISELNEVINARIR